MNLEAKELLSVRITRATDIIWEGKASSITSKNADGPFDVLPMHANFVTLIRAEPIDVVFPDGKKETHTFKYAVMHVKENKIRIYADFI